MIATLLTSDGRQWEASVPSIGWLRDHLVNHLTIPAEPVGAHGSGWRVLTKQVVAYRIEEDE